MHALRSFLSGLVVLGAVLLPPSVVAQSPDQPPAGAAVRPAGPAQGDYLIGPGDTLQIFVWRSPELSTEVPVRPDGRISTPLVEDMRAVGKTPAQLAADIEVALGEFIRGPKVSVIVSGAVGTLSQVQVIGQVKTPSAVAYRAGLRVLDVLLAVDGVTEFAAPNRSLLIRTENGKETRTRIRLGKLLDDGDLSQNLELRPGDIIVIPQSRF
jgi:polysaccharide export outer membrane protein